jgi:hypothetical protein
MKCRSFSPARGAIVIGVRRTQIGFGPFVATNTSNKVAVLRRLPAMVMRGSDKGRC